MFSKPGFSINIDTTKIQMVEKLQVVMRGRKFGRDLWPSR